MIDRIRLDLTRVRDLDISTARRVRVPHRRPPHLGEQTALAAALTAYAHTGIGFAGVMRDLLSIRDRPSVHLAVVGGVSGAPTRRSRDYTFAVGPSVTISPVATLALDGGVYLWIPPCEIGVFGSVGLGVTTNIGFSGGGQFTMLWGPAPSVLAGDLLGIGVDVSIPGGPISLSGMLFMTMASHPNLVGFGVTIAAGISFLPVDFTVQASTTWIRPIARI
jgi:hypothetical protein